MEFRRRQNDYYATLSSAGSRDPVGVVTESGIESELWLGTTERFVVRLIPGVKSVLLDVEAWRLTIIDAYEWLPAGTYMVGARVAGGVIGVIDGQAPMLRQMTGKGDMLGRKPTADVEEATPWFMRSI